MVEVLLSEKNLGFFSSLVPQVMEPAILAGETIGIGLMDEDYMAPMGILCCRETMGWMEIPWLMIHPDYQGQNLASFLLAERLRDGKKRGSVCGAFADLDESCEELIHVFAKNGFDQETVDLPLYSVTLAELAENSALMQGEKNGAVKSLGAMTDLERKAMEHAMEQDTRAIPLPSPISWDSYDQTCSTAYVAGTEVKGAILVSRQEESISVDLVWSIDKSVTVQLIRQALAVAMEQYPLETAVEIATLGDSATGLLEKLVPGTKPMTVTRMTKSFWPDGETMLNLDEMGD